VHGFQRQIKRDRGSTIWNIWNKDNNKTLVGFFLLVPFLSHSMLVIDNTSFSKFDLAQESNRGEVFFLCKLFNSSFGVVHLKKEI
jgi:hypothetical protein